MKNSSGVFGFWRSVRSRNMEDVRRVLSRLKNKLSGHLQEHLCLDTCVGNAERNAFLRMGLGLARITVSADCSRRTCEAIFRRVLAFTSSDSNERLRTYVDMGYTKTCYFQTLSTLLFVLDSLTIEELSSMLNFYNDRDCSMPKYFVGSAAIDVIHHQHLEIYFAQSARSIPPLRLSRRIRRSEVALPNAPPVTISSPDVCSVQNGSITGFTSLKTEIHYEGFRQALDPQSDAFRARNFYIRWTKNTPNVDCHEGTISINVPLIAAYTAQARECLDVSFERGIVRYGLFCLS